MDFEPLHDGNVAHEAKEDDEADKDDEDDAYEAGEFDDKSDLGNSEDTMDNKTEMDFRGWEPLLDPHNAQGAEQDSDGGVSDTAADADADADGELEKDLDGDVAMRETPELGGGADADAELDLLEAVDAAEANSNHSSIVGKARTQSEEL